MSSSKNYLLYLLQILRFVVLFVLSLLVLSPVIKYITRNFELPVIIIAQDNSESIGLAKPQGNFSFSEYFKNIETIQTKLGPDYKVRNFSFSSGVEEGINRNLKGKATDFSSLIDKINESFAGFNNMTLIVASDGLFNKGQNPVFAANRLSCPVYAIALGDTSRKRDIVLSNLNSNRMAFLGDLFPVELVINSNGFKNQMVRLTVSNANKILVTNDIMIDRDEFSKELKLNLPAENKGLQTYRIKLEPVVGEFNHLNNSRDLIIDIVDDKKKILILSGNIHPDIGALKLAMESNKNYYSEFYPVDQFKGKLTDYQLVVLYQLPSNQFNSQNIYNELFKNKIPVLFILGTQSDILVLNSFKLGFNISGSNKLYEQSISFLNQGFKLFETDEKMKELINNCPPITVPFGNYGIESGEVLFYQQIKGVKTQKPAIAFFQESANNGRTCLIAGEGIWRWRIKDFELNNNHEQFDGLINKIVHFMALDVKKDRFFVNHERVYNESEEIILRAGFYNQSYELTNSNEAEFKLYNIENKEFKHLFVKNDKSYYLNLGLLPVGKYRYTSKIKAEGKEFNVTGEFYVSESNIEHLELTANHSLLSKLASQGNGKLFYPNQIEQLVKEIKNNENIKKVSQSVFDFVDFIEIKLFFFLVILLLSTEWFIRKYFGSY
ncbi:MAG: hypothetical protein U0W24_05385 [Bacteroidales bacterium]